MYISLARSLIHSLIHSLARSDFDFEFESIESIEFCVLQAKAATSKLRAAAEKAIREAELRYTVDSTGFSQHGLL